MKTKTFVQKADMLMSECLDALDAKRPDCDYIEGLGDGFWLRDQSDHDAIIMHNGLWTAVKGMTMEIVHVLPIQQLCEYTDYIVNHY